MPQIESDLKRKFSVIRTDSSNANSNFTFLYLVRSFFLFSLPHVVIIVLFVVYSLLGAAILNEIESSDRPQRK